MNKEQKSYIKGMSDMLEWIKSLPLKGNAGRMLELHLFPIEDWMEKAKIEMKIKKKQLIY